MKALLVKMFVALLITGCGPTPSHSSIPANSRGSGENLVLEYYYAKTSHLKLLSDGSVKRFNDFRPRGNVGRYEFVEKLDRTELKKITDLVAEAADGKNRSFDGPGSRGSKG